MVTWLKIFLPIRREHLYKIFASAIYDLIGHRYKKIVFRASVKDDHKDSHIYEFMYFPTQRFHYSWKIHKRLIKVFFWIGMQIDIWPFLLSLQGYFYWTNNSLFSVVLITIELQFSLYLRYRRYWWLYGYC